MTTSRRAFLKAGALAVTGATLIPKQLFAEAAKKDVILGLQLYTVRDDMKTDPAGTLKQVAAIGFKYVEHAGYSNRKFYGYSAKDFRKLLESLNLKMKSGHVSFGLKDWDNSKKDFTDDWKYTVEDARTVGQEFVITPELDEQAFKNDDMLMKVLELFNKSGAYCKRYGLQFGYHNDFGSIPIFNGKGLYDIILDNTNPALVVQQLDIGNIYGAGGKPLQILKKYPGRFKLMHVKDEMSITGTGEMGNNYQSTILGKGLLPIKEIIDTARKMGGTKYFIIEQESYQDEETPIECSKEDFVQMRKWGF